MTTWLPRMCRCGHIGKEHPGPDGGGACTRDECDCTAFRLNPNR